MVYFRDVMQNLMNYVRETEKTLDIAVAWLNFELLQSIFIELLNKGVRIRIILNDSSSNHKYPNIESMLVQRGVEIKFLKLKGYMHHKFCIIDGIRCITGSFNWTNNASRNNYENITVVDNSNDVELYKNEFTILYDINNEKLQQIFFPRFCNECKGIIANLMLIRPDDENTSFVEIRTCCCCGAVNELKISGYLSIHAYLGIESIDDIIEDEYEELERYGEINSHAVILLMEDRRYLYIRDWVYNVSESIGWYNVIHAYAVYVSDEYGERYVVRWKERGCENMVLDEFYIR